jgi:hypothetical protein
LVPFAGADGITMVRRPGLREVSSVCLWPLAIWGVAEFYASATGSTSAFADILALLLPMFVSLTVMGYPNPLYHRRASVHLPRPASTTTHGGVQMTVTERLLPWAWKAERLPATVEA